NQDWAVGVRAESHYWVDLYRDEAGADVPVRFGAGRFSPGPGAGPMPPGYTGNANILDSIENLFNYHEHAKPISGGDVVWIMGTGVATDEIVFDDYIDHDAFIVSNMQASITPLRLGGLVLPIPIYHNGELAAGVIHWLGSLAPDVLPPNIPEEIFKLPAAIRLQNGATSLGWDVPDFGLVKGRGSRIEPTAIGGIKGKGFWLDGNNSITYDIREQPRNIRDHDWYISVFVDSRNATNTAQQLIGFSDYSALHLTPDNQLQYLKAGEVIHEFALPSGTGWQHLAFLLTDQNQTVTLYYNGFPLDRFRSAVPLFEMTPGQLKIGNPGRGKYKGDGFRGWIDDFKVLAHDVNPVEACHHARGFLIETNPGSEWYDHAMAHPGWAQEEVRGAAGGSVSSLYTCYHDYSGDYKAHLANLPDGSVLIKDQINFPEGPVAFGAPRPDSSNNPFCLRCHSEESKDGLSMDALEYHPDIMMEDDPRRQPHQPPRRVFGNIPGNWIVPGAGPGSPAEPVQAPPDGLLIDRWILPRGNFQGR
ncbi:MAG: LamG-like jellyroll fold domain-containing protein, partial [Ketobacteraceae bacterium]|nr:LamG-like jellyroll fold domain-containing protein [Ketobacteraceae bacterium]